MRPRTPAFAILVLLAGPAVAAAGPIDFSYTATGKADQAPARLYPGPVAFSLVAGGNVRLPPAGGSVEIGTVEFGPSPGPLADDTYTAWTHFDVSVAVTDQATGQSVTLALPGSAVDVWDYRSWDGRWTNPLHRLDLGGGFGGNTTSADIGFIRYTLSVRPEDDHQVGVYTLTATATNPEPGTLALALLALVPLGLRRARR